MNFVESAFKLHMSFLLDTDVVDTIVDIILGVGGQGPTVVP